ncbi:probable alkaline/neutral invertase B [Tanacetum coccineum]
MIDELSIVETDKVNHTVEMDMLKLVVEVECFDVGPDKRLGSESISSGEVPVLAAATDFATRGLDIKDVHHVRAIAVNVRDSYPELRKLFEDATKLFSSIGKKGLRKDGWPEYYDGKSGRYIGKQARKHQTWSVAGYVVAKMLIEDPTRLSIIALGDDKQLKPALRRSSSTSDVQTSKTQVFP